MNIKWSFDIDDVNIQKNNRLLNFLPDNVPTKFWSASFYRKKGIKPAEAFLRPKIQQSCRIGILMLQFFGLFGMAWLWNTHSDFGHFRFRSDFDHFSKLPSEWPILLHVQINACKIPEKVQARNSTIFNTSSVQKTIRNSFVSRKYGNSLEYSSPNINFLYKMLGVSEGSYSNIYGRKTFASHVLRQIASCKVPMNILSSHR